MKKILNYNKATILPIILLLLLMLSGCGGGTGTGSSNSVSKIGEYNTSDNSGNGSNSSPISGSVKLAWEAPTTNNDGSELNDLAGYKVHYGASSCNYTESVDIGNNTSAAISNLSPGTWCFAVTAYDYAGNESGSSEEVCTVIS